jgi:hypothetical protein
MQHTKTLSNNNKRLLSTKKKMPTNAVGRGKEASADRPVDVRALAEPEYNLPCGNPDEDSDED